MESAVRPFDRGGIDFRIIDEGAPAGERLLYSSEPSEMEALPLDAGNPDNQNQAPLTWRSTIDIAGRRWTFHFSQAPESVSARKFGEAWSVLTEGLFFSSMLGVFLLLIVGRSAATDEAVRLRTSELNISNVNLTNEIEIRERAEKALLEAQSGLEQRVEQRTEELTSLNELAQRVISCLSLEQVVQAALGEVSDRVVPDLALFFLRDGDRLVLRGCGPNDSPFLHDQTPVHRVGQCLCGLAVSGDGPVYSSDIRSDSRCTWDECKKAGLRSFAALPLRGGGEIIGVLGLGSGKTRGFASRSVFLEALANWISIGLHNALLHDQVNRHADDLEQRVAERTTELTLARDRAEAADRLKSTFLAAMSHELRTPLNSILGFTGILLQGRPGPLNAEQKKQLGMVQNSSRHLLGLINEVLDLSKIEAGQLEIRSEPFDLRAAIDKVVLGLAPLAEAKGLSLVARVDPDLGQVDSDRRRVEQILINLVNNAVKFTNAGSVRVEASVAEGQVTTSVTDTGIGIRPEDFDSLFESFRQIDSGLSRLREGTGLGLSISKKLVEMLGGEIRVESEWGVGSSFSFTLPLNPGEAP